MKKLLFVILLCLSFISCATVNKKYVSSSFLSSVPDDALCYARSDKEFAEFIVPFITTQSDSIKPIIKNVSNVGIAYNKNEKKYNLIIDGSFPSFFANISLSLNKSWITKSNEHKAIDNDLYVYFKSSKRIYMANSSTLDLASKENSFTNNKIPENLETYWQKQFAVYFPKPLEFLSSFFKLEEVPLDSIMINAQKENSNLNCSISFIFSSNRNAIIFLPLCKILVYGLVKLVDANNISDIQNNIKWETVENISTSSNIILDSNAIIKLIEAFKTM